MSKRKIAVLGAGAGAMSAVLHLTNQPDWQERYEITVYQLGWRIGGKGASGRNALLGERIQEHGLHIWMGFYENAFRVMQMAYDELHEKNLAPGSPFQNWRDAFQPQNLITAMESTSTGWEPWGVPFLTNPFLPGNGEGEGVIWDLCIQVLDWALENLERLRIAQAESEAHPEGGLLSSLLHSLASRVEEAIHRSALDAAAELAHRLQQTSPDFREGLVRIFRLLDKFNHQLGDILETLIDPNDLLRRLAILVDFGVAAVRGMIADDVFDRGFEVLDEEDFIEWLSRHGCRNPKCPPVMALYDACFAYEDGDPNRPNLGAGTALYGGMRMALTYKGSIFWRMNAGMGDTIFTPMYLVLKSRGVRFQFFRQVTQLRLNSDKNAIEEIEINVQATVKSGEYQPLIPVKQLPCWPRRPDLAQLVEGDRLEGVNLESAYTDWPGVGTQTLKRSNGDFDDVILGISLGALPFIARELKDASPRWGAMMDHLKTVVTQASQFWMNRTSAELGFQWDQADPTHRPSVSGYVEPFDTWADMSHLLPTEAWPPSADVKSIAYFVSAMRLPHPLPPPEPNPKVAEDALALVQRNVKNFVERDLRVLWPDAFDANGNFRYEFLVDPLGGQGKDRLLSQFFRVNIDPTELYVLTVKGSTKYRIHPGDSGFTNLFPAGDWTWNLLNGGCVEAAVISGMLASRAISGQPDRIFGAWGVPVDPDQRGSKL